MKKNSTKAKSAAATRKGCQRTKRSAGSRAAHCSPAPPLEMSDEEFDELIDRWNKACIVKYGKTVCTLFEEGEAESAQENK